MVKEKFEVECWDRATTIWYWNILINLFEPGSESHTHTHPQYLNLTELFIWHSFRWEREEKNTSDTHFFGPKQKKKAAILSALEFNRFTIRKSDESLRGAKHSCLFMLKDFFREIRWLKRPQVRLERSNGISCDRMFHALFLLQWIFCVFRCAKHLSSIFFVHVHVHSCYNKIIKRNT